MIKFKSISDSYKDYCNNFLRNLCLIILLKLNKLISNSSDGLNKLFKY